MGWAARAAKVHQRFDKAAVTLRYHFPDNRRRDPDNYNGKFILDGLREAGVLADDDFGHISLTVERGDVDKRNPRVEVRISEREVGT